MKIVKLTTFLVPPRWCFLKIETDEGVSGWGEPVVEGRAQTVAAAVEELSDYLIGKDPRLIEDHWTVMYRGGFHRGGAVHRAPSPASTKALWDIKGDALGQPAHALLGGQIRDRIRVYAWIGGDRPGDTARMARDCADRGFTAVKMNGANELQIVDNHAKIDAALERVQAIRDELGPTFGIGVDFHGRAHRPMAKVLAKELEPFELMFIEESALSEHAGALKEIATNGPRRSRWPRTCSSTRSATTPSSRSSRSASTTTPPTTWSIRRSSPIATDMWRSRRDRPRHRGERGFRAARRRRGPPLAQSGLAQCRWQLGRTVRATR